MLELDANKRKGTIRPYSHTQLVLASLDYLTLEKRILGDSKDAVLVSADSIESLKLAFPNYYLDTVDFLELPRDIVTPRIRQLELF